MSLIEDTLLPEKLKAVRKAKKELEDEKNNYYLVLGEWLENALQDDNNELKKLFISESENKKYLSRKYDRNIAKKIADKLSATDKLKASNHAQNIANQDNLTNNDINS